ncbi:hypothetical protein [Leucothrix arctica]|uniref:DUF983 domain-containing protein n=1 Tax=Leucothrix arctica TaxID=1481894 RepID=A0A317CFZ1_9GAMM|nr:hypothetical protein [Leucothrix arctica]PWQ97465.1 hypothetical protein DKT75_05940 [Leucothrix arctica]
MKCPSCRIKAINFITWAQGLSAFKTNCSNCNTALKANALVYVILLFTLIATFSFFPYVEGVVGYLGLSDINSKLKVFVLIPVILLGAALAWFFGGYKISKKQSYSK